MQPPGLSQKWAETFPGGARMFGAHRDFPGGDLLLVLHIAAVLADAWQDFLRHPVLEGLGGGVGPLGAEGELVQSTLGHKGSKGSLLAEKLNKDL